MTTTDSTTEFVKAIIQRIRLYEDALGRSVGTICDNRVYVSQAPDGVTGTYVVLRVELRSDPEFGTREEFTIEGDVYVRPRAKEQEAELVAELLAKALLEWRVSGANDGYVAIETVDRAAEDLSTDPEDRELVRRSIIAHGHMWPRYLTSLSS